MVVSPLRWGGFHQQTFAGHYNYRERQMSDLDMMMTYAPHAASWDRAEPMRRVHKNANRTKLHRRSLNGAFGRSKFYTDLV
jgi:hypothetical protein